MGYKRSRVLPERAEKWGSAYCRVTEGRARLHRLAAL